MSDLKIQKIWQCSFDSFLSSGHPVSDIQKKVSHAVMRCKSGALPEPMPANVPSVAIQNSTIIPAVTGTAQTARLS